MRYKQPRNVSRTSERPSAEHVESVVSTVRRPASATAADHARRVLAGLRPSDHQSLDCCFPLCKREYSIRYMPGATPWNRRRYWPVCDEHMRELGRHLDALRTESKAADLFSAVTNEGD